MSIHVDPIQDEAGLVRSGLQGDREAINTLFARHTRPLYQTALRLLGNPEDAEDALQDGLLSAARNFKRFEGRSKFSTWLTRIVINAALMRLRSQRARPTISLEQEDPEQRDLTLGSRIPDSRPGPEERYVRKERYEILERGLETLPPYLQSALWLRDIEGLSTAEAARALGLSEGTLKSQLHRARSRLVWTVRNNQGLSRAPAAA
ncbi:MAG TPA: sigma-70 family RNA polymerase sigma factor [Terriglobia bacterium]|nr:sigma-70 family RNA polymerase sigma factor [Terriglobia bacterium]